MPTPNNQIRRRGSFAPLSAHYYLDDALAQAGEAAELLYVRGLAFCAATLSDGLITAAQLPRGPGVGMRDAEKRARRLVEVGAWVETDDGWRIRSWLGWNKSRDEIMAAVEADRERKSRGGKGRPLTPPPGDRQPGSADSERNPTGVAPESGRSRNGVRTDSGSNSTYTYTDTSTYSPAAASDVRPDRARNPHAPPVVDLAATAHSPAAHRLVEAYAATCRRRPTAKICSQLAVETDALVAEDWPEPDIAAALDAWGSKSLGPGALQAVAHEVANRRPTRSRPATTDVKVGQVLALRDRFPGAPPRDDEPPALTAGGPA